MVRQNCKVSESDTYDPISVQPHLETSNLRFQPCLFCCQLTLSSLFLLLSFSHCLLQRVRCAKRLLLGRQFKPSSLIRRSPRRRRNFERSLCFGFGVIGILRGRSLVGQGLVCSIFLRGLLIQYLRGLTVLF